MGRQPEPTSRQNNTATADLADLYLAALTADGVSLVKILRNIYQAFGIRNITEEVPQVPRIN